MGGGGRGGGRIRRPRRDRRCWGDRRACRGGRFPVRPVRPVRSVASRPGPHRRSRQGHAGMDGLPELLGRLSGQAGAGGSLAGVDAPQAQRHAGGGLCHPGGHPEHAGAGQPLAAGQGPQVRPLAQRQGLERHAVCGAGRCGRRTGRAGRTGWARAARRRTERRARRAHGVPAATAKLAQDGGRAAGRTAGRRRDGNRNGNGHGRRV